MFLDWDGARALAATGHGIGLAHRHPPDPLPRGQGTQRHELTASRRALEEGLGQTVDLLAYPNGNAGDYDDADDVGARAVRATARPSPPVPGLVGPNEPPFAMHRIVLTPLTDVGELFGKVARKGTGLARRITRGTARSGA